jgi:hypothetical protein
MVLTCILKECKLLLFHGFEKAWFYKTMFFKVIGQKHHLVWCTRQKSNLLSCALQLAHEKMANTKNWDEICSEAVKIRNKCGITVTKNSTVVRIYTAHFEENEN